MFMGLGYSTAILLVAGEQAGSLLEQELAMLSQAVPEIDDVMSGVDHVVAGGDLSTVGLTGMMTVLAIMGLRILNNFGKPFVDAWAEKLRQGYATDDLERRLKLQNQYGKTAVDEAVETKDHE